MISYSIIFKLLSWTFSFWIIFLCKGVKPLSSICAWLSDSCTHYDVLRLFRLMSFLLVDFPEVKEAARVVVPVAELYSCGPIGAVLWRLGAFHFLWSFLSSFWRRLGDPGGMQSSVTSIEAGLPPRDRAMERCAIDDCAAPVKCPLFCRHCVYHTKWRFTHKISRFPPCRVYQGGANNMNGFPECDEATVHCEVASAKLFTVRATVSETVSDVCNHLSIKCVQVNYKFNLIWLI